MNQNARGPHSLPSGSRSDHATMRPRSSDRIDIRAIQAGVNRLQAVLDLEIAALQDGKLNLLGELLEKKRQILIELSLAGSWDEVPLSEAPLLEDLRLLKSRLEESERLLKLHLAAVEAIAETLAGSIRSSEHDGTYSRFTQRGTII